MRILAESQMALNRLGATLRGLVQETLQVAKDLFLILIPSVVIVKILQEGGIVELLSAAVEPLMRTFGLPGEMAIVWTTAIVTNIYGAMAVFMMVAPELEMTTAQMTVLSTMILICHSLPVELALTQRVGCHFLFLGPLRFLGACLCGWCLHLLFRALGLFSGAARILWTEQRVETSWVDWGWNQAVNFLFILAVLFGLLAMMRFLNYTGFSALMGRLLRPLLLVMGISSQGASIAVFGLLAGITFGSGLLLAEVKKNSIPDKDVVLVLAFLSLSHGIIEDTALMMLLGGHLSGILLFRLLFSVAVLAILSKLPFIRFEKLRLGQVG